MSGLRIRLLGTIQIDLDEKPVSSLKTNKALGLLSYLAVEADRPHRRETLAGIFLPEKSCSLREIRWRLNWSGCRGRKVMVEKCPLESKMLDGQVPNVIAVIVHKDTQILVGQKQQVAMHRR